MLSTTERMKLLEKRTNEIKKRRDIKKYMCAVTLCYLSCIVLIVTISAFVCNLNFVGFEQAPLSNTASIFANKDFLNYVVIGVLAFLLGTSVTFLCNMLHKRRKAKEGENDRTDR